MTIIKIKDMSTTHTFVKMVLDRWNTSIKQCAVIKQKLDSMPAEEWFEKHTAVSAEDC